MAAPPDAVRHHPHRADRLRQLLDVGRSLNAELDLDTLLERILDTGRELCGARYAALGVLDEEHRELTRLLTSGAPPDAHTAVGPGAGGPGLDTPITVRGEPWGTLYLGGKADDQAFDEDDLEAIVVLAEWAAIAIDNARLYGISERRSAELQRAVGGLEASRDIALALGDETDLPRVLELIVSRGRELVRSDALLIWLADGDVLRLAAHAGAATPAPDTVIPAAGSTAGEALRTGLSIRIDDVATGLGVGALHFGVAGARGALLVPLVFRGRGLGVLAAFDRSGGDRTAFDDDDERALRSFAASAAIAVSTARSVEAQRLRDSLAASEAERRRWARDLHDETLQGLGATKLALSAALRGDPAQVRAGVALAVAQLDEEIGALRGIIADLRPPALDELGLQPAVRSLAERVGLAGGLRVQLELGLGERRLDAEVETIAYRVAQEALTNVLKHARATWVRVRLRATVGTLEVLVEDDGRGFDAGRPSRSGAYGLIGMGERAQTGGGRLTVAARPAGGTAVSLALPLGGAG